MARAHIRLFPDGYDLNYLRFESGQFEVNSAVNGPTVGGSYIVDVDVSPRSSADYPYVIQKCADKANGSEYTRVLQGLSWTNWASAGGGGGAGEVLAFSSAFSIAVESGLNDFIRGTSLVSPADTSLGTLDDLTGYMTLPVGLYVATFISTTAEVDVTFDFRIGTTVYPVHVDKKVTETFYLSSPKIFSTELGNWAIGTTTFTGSITIVKLK